jgi:hypothetical protein
LESVSQPAIKRVHEAATRSRIECILRMRMFGWLVN